MGVIIGLVFLGSFLQPETGCERTENPSQEMNQPVILAIGLLILIITIFWLTTLKGYKPAGSLLFNACELKIEKGDLTEIIPVGLVSELRFVFKAIEGDTAPGTGFLGVLGYTQASDGSGNMLIFRFNDLEYKLNLVLESREDFNAMGHLFREIAGLYGFQPELIDISGK